MPIRPINISEQITIFPVKESSAVIPKDIPVVPKAEATSTIIAIKEKSSIAVKKIDSKVRAKMRQELRRMKAGVIGWDENIENANKIRAFERSLCWYEIT